MKSQTNKFQPVYRGIVVFDLDGVLADFDGAFCDAFGYDRREEYHLRKRYPEHADTVSEWVNEPKNYIDLAPIFGGVVWMNQCIGAGYYVAIVTARHINLPIITEAWLDKYNIRPHTIVHATNKPNAINDLSENLNLPVILFVDDSIENLKQVGEEIGCECAAWASPWNVDWRPLAWYDPDRMAVRIEK